MPTLESLSAVSRLGILSCSQVPHFHITAQVWERFVVVPNWLIVIPFSKVPSVTAQTAPTNLAEKVQESSSALFISWVWGLQGRIRVFPSVSTSSTRYPSLAGFLLCSSLLCPNVMNRLILEPACQLHLSLLNKLKSVGQVVCMPPGRSLALLLGFMTACFIALGLSCSKCHWLNASSVEGFSARNQDKAKIRCLSVRFLLEPLNLGRSPPFPKNSAGSHLILVMATEQSLHE